MIFDKNFDKTLWLMLKVDKKNRRRILEFVRSIPKELYEQLLNKLKIVNEHRRQNMPLNSYLVGEYETSKKLLYWFEYNSFSNELSMGYKVFTGKKYEDAFEMTLVSSEEFFDSLNFANKYVGSVEYDIKEEKIDDKYSIVDSSKSEYDIMRTPLGYMIFCTDEDSLIFKHHINIVNINYIPNELYMNDIEDKNTVNRLVRSRKRN